jgi:hypothetical protein
VSVTEETPTATIFIAKLLAALMVVAAVGLAILVGPYLVGSPEEVSAELATELVELQHVADDIVTEIGGTFPTSEVELRCGTSGSDAPDPLTVVTFSVKTDVDVRAVVGDALGRAGYAEVGSTPISDGSEQEFGREGGQVVVSLSTDPNLDRTQVFLSAAPETAAC